MLVEFLTAHRSFQDRSWEMPGGADSMRAMRSRRMRLKVRKIGGLRVWLGFHLSKKLLERIEQGAAR